MNFINQLTNAFDFLKQAVSEIDVTNTDEELRILEETRRRLEEQQKNQLEASNGQRSLPPPPTIVIDESPDFDHFFKQVLTYNKSSRYPFESSRLHQKNFFRNKFNQSEC